MQIANSTKMICTLGPASQDPDIISCLLEAGMDLARLNFSHGDAQNKLELVRHVRNLSEQQGRHTAILGDLQGPKIRTGKLVGGGPAALEAGQELVITVDPVVGDAQRISTTYESLPQDLQPGDAVLLDDGLISLEVLSTDEQNVYTRVINGGELGEHKGINLPGVTISTPSLTAKDRQDLEFIIENDFDYVALSFVRSVEDVRLLKQLISEYGGTTAVIAKIEKPEAIAEIEEIVEEADATMVARGDLGVEMSPEEVPILQRRIMSLCAHKRKPVIIATQMLDSMREHPRPTRAEASDVAGAIFTGADAVMLSGETAVGQYPIEAARMMQRICIAAEQEHMAGSPLRTSYAEGDFVSFADALARSAAEIAEAVRAAAIVAFTQSGSTARLISMCRTRVPVFAATPLTSTARYCSLYWGVHPVLIPPVEDTDAMITHVERTMKQREAVKSGDVIVITAGTPIGQAGTTNMLKLQTIE